MKYLTKTDGSKFTENELQLLSCEWEIETVLPGAEVIDEGKWEVDHKYQYCTVIFKYQDKFYGLNVVKRGSPFDDWYYQYDDQPYEVTKVQKVIENWEAV